MNQRAAGVSVGASEKERNKVLSEWEEYVRKESRENSQLEFRCNIMPPMIVNQHCSTLPLHVHMV